MKRFMMSVSDQMYTTLEKERKDRQLDTIQETVRLILSEHIRHKKQQ